MSMKIGRLRTKPLSIGDHAEIVKTEGDAIRISKVIRMDDG